MLCDASATTRKDRKRTRTSTTKTNISCNEDIKEDTNLENEYETVDLTNNKLATVSEKELGLPFVRTARIGNNPLYCGSEMLWLINKISCLEKCQGRFLACCLECEACFLDLDPEYNFLQCASPKHLEGKSLASAITNSEPCETQQCWAPTTVDHVLDGGTLDLSEDDTHGTNVCRTQTYTFVYSFRSSSGSAEGQNDPSTQTELVTKVTQDTTTADDRFTDFVPTTKTTKISQSEESGILQIILISFVSFLGLSFISLVTAKIINSKISDDNAAAAQNNIMLYHNRAAIHAPNSTYFPGLAQVIPPIENSACNVDITPNVATLQPESLNQIIPPIENSLYGGTQDAGTVPGTSDSTPSSVLQPIQGERLDIASLQAFPWAKRSPLENSYYDGGHGSGSEQGSNDYATSSVLQPIQGNPKVGNSLGIASLQVFPCAKSSPIEKSSFGGTQGLGKVVVNNDYAPSPVLQNSPKVNNNSASSSVLSVQNIPKVGHRLGITSLQAFPCAKSSPIEKSSYGGAQGSGKVLVNNDYAQSPVLQNSPKVGNRLDSDQDYFVRGVKEVVYIRAHHPSLNRDGGRFRLPATFDALLTSSSFRLPESDQPASSFI
ncbi:Low-density lipoprotein receptor domain class A [Branchiostoma belcheri]|nr:Low-density lipoprotein receptor domain class A [Branchiostoma belcheri]